MTQSGMDRRTLLKTAGLGTMGSILGQSCASRVARLPALPSPRNLAKVNASWDRVIRTVVGLRPSRRGGFLVKAEQFDGKTVIHNYGHGSKGVTLSWGTAHLAVEEAMKTGQTRYAVMGCGVVGLATARLLQRRGFGVTIYAKDLPPDTTSNTALAIWGPYTDIGPGRVLSDQYTRAIRLSYRYFQDLVGDYYGVRWIDSYTESRPEVLANLKDPFQDLRLDFQELGRDDHPFPTPSVLRWVTLLIEPPIYLNALMRDFQLAGGQIIVREFPDLRSVLALPEPALMNCTGLGARALFGDEALSPWKGQTTLLLPQPDVDYHVDMPGVEMVSRKDGIAIGGGGDSRLGDWTLEPDLEAARMAVARASDFFNRMR